LVADTGLAVLQHVGHLRRFGAGGPDAALHLVVGDRSLSLRVESAVGLQVKCLILKVCHAVVERLVGLCLDEANVTPGL
jgi:hypothetical protein